MNAENRAVLIQARLAAVRAELKAANLSILVVPSSDPHISEYLPDHWKSREWLSGFTGSVGTLVVTQDEAALFADSRYWTQAEQELAGTSVELVKITSALSPAHLEWIERRLTPGGGIAVDGEVIGLAAARALQAVAQRCGARFETGLDLLDSCWANRPALPKARVYEHDASFIGQSRSSKLAQVRERIKAAGCNLHFISSLDDIAWLLNLRGQDVEYNPVFLAHLLVTETSLTLFIDNDKIDANTRTRLSSDGVEIRDYLQAQSALAQLASDGQADKILLDPKRVTWAFRQAIPDRLTVVEQINPSQLLKSRKNTLEIEKIRATMEQDGAALCEFFAWFEKTLGYETITELRIHDEITAARARRPGFVCPSFATIAGFNANGALPHYRALPESHAVIEGNGLLLIDSGGQYLGGTTDITRVIPINSITPAMRRDFTLVLKGMIGLSQARFPRGTAAPMLDSLARLPLWQAGMDFGHGTGHGVGYFLNVHEGPQSISKTIPDVHMAMEPGMITSNEPGLYREGQWGIRIENLVLNVPYIDPIQPEGFGEFLEFETLTLCPIDTRCVEISLLRADERQWLNDYHTMVRKRLSPHVSGEALSWLLTRTEPI